MFKPSEEFRKDVEEKNVINIRVDLNTVILADRGFYTTEFDEMLTYAETSHIEGLYDVFDGEEFKSKEEWNQEYWRYLVASLGDNFCKERINHLKEVGRYVYPKQQKTTNNTSSANRFQKKEENNEEKKQSSIIVVGVAAVAALIGYTIVGTKTAAIGAAIIAGGLMLAKEKK